MKRYINERHTAAPSELEEFIDWVRGLVEKTGQPSKNVSIELDYEDQYGGTSPCLSLSYEREETDKEREEREARQKRFEDAERRNYERLKAKFG